MDFDPSRKMSAFENVGGKLKLKGKALDVKAGGMQKKKKHKKHNDQLSQISENELSTEPTRGPFVLDDNKKIFSRDFQVGAEVLESDSVMDPRVGARLIYSTILPRDESQHLSTSFPKSMDEPEQELINAIQKMVSSNAQGRAYSQKMEAKVARWREKQAEWDDERQGLLVRLRRSDEEIKGLRAQLFETQAGSSNLHGMIKRLRKEKEVTKHEQSELRATHEKLLQEHSLRILELKASREDVASSRQRIQELEDQRGTACAEAVKAYRLSKDCQLRKGRYAAGFTRYGFYLARSHLESQRPGETFPELVFTPEIENMETLDWRQYNDPLPVSPDSYLKSRLVDNLENLTGPWEPYDFHPDSDNMTEALQDLGVSREDNQALYATTEKEESEISDART